MPTIEELNSRTADGTPTGIRGFQPFDPERGVAAAEANKQALAWARITNQQRKMQHPSKMVLDLRAKNRVWIYNVGPWAHTRGMGSLGDFNIPKCPDGIDYVRMDRIIPFDEPVIKDEKNMEMREEMGWGDAQGALYNAQQIIGEGPFLSPINCLIPCGCFIGSEVGPDARPTSEELAKAHEALTLYYQSLVADARQASDEGPKALAALVNDKHHLAAAKLKLDPKVELWMSRKMDGGSTRARCEMCGEVYEIGIAVCKCGNILDEEKFLKNEDRLAKIRAKLKPAKA